MRTQTTGHESIEMYLKTIAELGGVDAPVSVADLAARLGVSAVSANEMAQRLAEQALVDRIHYKGVRLTDSGRRSAYSVMRRQRLWECFLADHLHLAWPGVYESACRLEHATSNVLADALDAYLGRPAACPHGNPIPAHDGTMAPLEGIPLADLPRGRPARIRAIAPTTTDIYAYFHQRGLVPGQTVTVREVAPLDGPLTLACGDRSVVLGRNLARLLTVAAVAAER